MDELLNRKTLMTRREVAEVLALKESTIRAKTARGEIPSVKLGAAVRYRPGDIYRYIAEHTRGGPRPPSAITGLNKRSGGDHERHGT